jgi:hypothetical protein
VVSQPDKLAGGIQCIRAPGAGAPEAAFLNSGPALNSLAIILSAIMLVILMAMDAGPIDGTFTL